MFAKYSNFLLQFLKRASIITGQPLIDPHTSSLRVFLTVTEKSQHNSGGHFMDPTMIIVIVAMIAIFYFFMIRPEKKKKKALADMRDSLSVGDSITTIGGILGKVVSVDGDKVTFETSEDRVRVQVAKWAISTVGRPPEEQPK